MSSSCLVLGSCFRHQTDSRLKWGINIMLQFWAFLSFFLLKSVFNFWWENCTLTSKTLYFWQTATWCWGKHLDCGFSVWQKRHAKLVAHRFDSLSFFAHWFPAWWHTFELWGGHNLLLCLLWSGTKLKITQAHFSEDTSAAFIPESCGEARKNSLGMRVTLIESSTADGARIQSKHRLFLEKNGESPFLQKIYSLHPSCVTWFVPSSSDPTSRYEEATLLVCECSCCHSVVCCLVNSSRCTNRIQSALLV